MITSMKKSWSFLSDVAFEVGHGTAAPYLVLQVHYGKVDKFKGELVIIIIHASEVAFTTGTCLFGIKYLRLVIEIEYNIHF